jgi:hypothetical protein
MTAPDEVPKPVRRGSALLAAAGVLALLAVVAGTVASVHLGSAGDAYLREVTVSGTVGQDDLPHQLSLGLLYDIATMAVLALVAAGLSRAIRFPLRRAQIAAWVTAAAVWPVLGCGLAAGPEVPALDASRPPLTVEVLRHALLVGWYPEVHSVLVFGLLFTLTATAVLLLRTPAQDYFQPGSAGAASDWSAFIRDH